MSKIEAAIERAKAIREHTESLHTAEPESNVSAVPSHPDGPRRATGLLSVDAVRQVPMQPEVAFANRVLGADAGAASGQTEYRMLRTRLMSRMRANKWRVLGVSAAGEGEGKTLTALNLAISIAAEVGQEAVLLELDLKRPRVAETLGIPPTSFTSVTEYLSNESTSVDDLLFGPGIERLGCVLCSEPLARSSDLLASRRGHQLFQDLRRRLLPQTIVVVDLPPLLSADDALVVAPLIDAMLFVVAEGATKRSSLTEAAGLLAEFNVIGTVLNKSVEANSGRYY